MSEDNCVLLMTQWQRLSPIYQKLVAFSFLLCLNTFFVIDILMGKSNTSHECSRLSIGLFWEENKRIKSQTQLGCWISMILFGVLTHNVSTELSRQPSLRHCFRLTAKECSVEAAINIPSVPAANTIKLHLKSSKSQVRKNTCCY